MSKNWAFKIGVALFFLQALVLPLGSPIALGTVSFLCLGFLTSGLFLSAATDYGIVRFVLRVIINLFLILIAGRALFLVAESLFHDSSSDIYVGNIVGVALILSLVALVYGIARQIRARQVA